MSLILGLDVGTATGAAATKHGGRVQPCPLGRNTATVPAVVVLHDDGSAVLGEEAERIAGLELPRTARELRNDPATQALPITVAGHAQPPYEMLRTLYKAVLQRVEEVHGRGPTQAVLTHPAMPENLRCALVERIADDLAPGAVTVPDPVAATVKLACDGVLPTDCVVAVYDLGGGTFDATVVQRSGDQFSVLGEPGGLADFGGIDVDDLVLTHVDRALDGAVVRLDLTDPEALAAYGRLRAECRDAKERLSYDTEITIDATLPGTRGIVRLTRTELDALVVPRLETTLQVLRSTVEGAGLQAGDIDAIALVGGSTRSPAVVDLLTARTSVQVLVDPYPELTVALGAAQMVDEEVNRSSVFPMADMALASTLASAADALHGEAAENGSLPGGAGRSGDARSGVGTALAEPPAGAPPGTPAGAPASAAAGAGPGPKGGPAKSPATDPGWDDLSRFGTRQTGESAAATERRAAAHRSSAKREPADDEVGGRMVVLACLVGLLLAVGVGVVLLGGGGEEAEPSSASVGFGADTETTARRGRSSTSSTAGDTSSSSSSGPSTTEADDPLAGEGSTSTAGDTSSTTAPAGSPPGGGSPTTLPTPTRPSTTSTSTTSSTTSTTTSTTSTTTTTTTPASTTSSSSAPSTSSTSSTSSASASPWDFSPTLRTEGAEG
jgi:molecular chaperone DnaK